ncbi:hypothetical protein ACIBCR_15400 [Micromonospora echinospora]
MPTSQETRTDKANALRRAASDLSGRARAEALEKAIAVRDGRSK